MMRMNVCQRHRWASPWTDPYMKLNHCIYCLISGFHSKDEDNEEEEEEEGASVEARKNKAHKNKEGKLFKIS